MTASLGPVITVLVILCFISAIFCLLVHVSGWRTLASAYRAREPFRGKLLRFRTGRVGQTHFGHCLTLGSSPAGLYLAVSFPFGFGYRPLLIPWDGVAVSLKKIWFYEYWEFHFGELAFPTLMVGKPLGQEILQASTGSRSRFP